MDINLLTDKLLNIKLIEACAKERKATLSVMDYLMELDSRKLYRESGYSSLFDFCLRKLGYSEGSAYRRIAGGRCMKEKPELKALFLEGKVTLCSIATAYKSIEANKTKVENIVGKSKREVELLVSKNKPIEKPKEVLK